MDQPDRNTTDKKSKVKNKQPYIDQEDDYLHGGGRMTIAPDVLATIARLTTLETSGVSRMSPVPGGVSRFIHKTAADGVDMKVENNIVSADLYVVVTENVNMRDVSRNIQLNVTRAISEMAGLHIGRVNVHIEDIDYPLE